MEDDSGTVCADANDGDTSTLDSNNIEKADSGNVLVNGQDEKKEPDAKEDLTEVETFEDAQSLELENVGVEGAGSDSGVEGCGRALSSGGGTQSCASSVVSCGSACGSESSSLAGAGGAGNAAGTGGARRRVTVAEPGARARAPTAPPRPATAPRAPSLATRERARSREKPTPPEKPRPLTPKPRIRPTADLPNLVRESPALRAKPTKTSAARCRTPNSPTEEKRWPVVGRMSMSAEASRTVLDKYGTLPRRRRPDGEPASPQHEAPPPPARRPALARSLTARAAKPRVRIYAEKTSQTVLIGDDVESALAGVTPNIDCRVAATTCSRGVQAGGREELLSRLGAAEAALAGERAARARLERELADERAAARAARAHLHDNTRRLLDLAGRQESGGSAEGCLRALEEQLRSAADVSAKQRAEIDTLKARCDTLHEECRSSAEQVRSLEARLGEAEREAAEMQDFLAAETGALGHALRDCEAELARARDQLDKRRCECRQLVRLCEQRRQETLAAAARARSHHHAHDALAALALRLERLCASLRQHSHSSSVEAGSPLEELPRGGLVAAVSRALRLPVTPLTPVTPLPPLPPLTPVTPVTPLPPLSLPAPGTPLTPACRDDRSHASDDNSAELLDSETEPCLVQDPDCADEWVGGSRWSLSGSELSPSADESISERDSLANLSLAIAARHRTERQHITTGTSLVDKVVHVDNKVTELLRALRIASEQCDDADSAKLTSTLREKLELNDCHLAESLGKLASMDANKGLVDQYWHFNEMLKKQLVQPDEENLNVLEEEIQSCSESERRDRYEALDSALNALSARERVVCSWPRLANVHAALERMAFAVASAPAVASATSTPLRANGTPLHTTA